MQGTPRTSRRLRKLVPVVVLALLPVGLAAPAHAANPNALDTTCNGVGNVDYALGNNDQAFVTLLQPDGKILSIGTSDGVGLSQDMIVARYTTTCQADPSFGNSFDTGVLDIDASGADRPDEARAALLQPDGKIVLAGTRSNGVNNDAVVVRLTAAGALDTTWDGDGISAFDIGATESVTGVARQADGKIVISGSTNVAGNLDSFLARFNTNGSRDDTFNGNGYRTYANSVGNADEFTGVAIEADGKIVASGYANNGTNDDGIAERVNANGSPDGGFGTSGVYTEATADVRFNAVAIRPTTQQVLLGGYTNNFGSYDFMLRQLTSAGATDGFNTANLGGDDRANAIALQQDNGVVLAGSSDATGGSGIAKFGNGLGTDYTVTAGKPCGDADTLGGVAVAQDGTIVASGTCDAGGAPDFILARWYGSPVLRFASAGYTVKENVGSAVVTVTRKGTLNAVTMDYSTSAGTATAGSDYTTSSGTLNFAVGVASQNIAVPITNDTAKEAAESFTITLANAGPFAWSATLGTPATTTVTIAASDQRPDGQIKANGGSYVGNNVYNTTGAGQTVTQNGVRGQKKVYYVTVQNDGNVANTLLVKGAASSAGYTVAYFASTTSTNITSAVTHAGYSTGSLAVGASKVVRVEITALSTAVHGSTKSVAITSSWTGDGVVADVVKANMHTA